VALIERGERGVSIEAMNRIAEALDLPAGCLAILGSVAESGHPRSVGLLKSLQELVTSAVDLQQDLRRKTSSTPKKRGRKAVHR
jgi:transcriptional regulator with XRE-family HTH domain